MNESITLKFNNVKKVFPSGITKFKMPLGARKLVNEKGKFMTLKEIDNLREFERNWGRSNNINNACYEYYAKRETKSVKLICFDDEE